MSLAQALARTDLVLGTRKIKDLISGDTIKLEFSNDFTTSFHGGGNKIGAVNSNETQAKLTIRLIAGSSDDLYFSDFIKEVRAGSAFFLPNGSLTRVFKREGDNAETKDVYQIKAPSIDKYNSNGIVFSTTAGEDAILNEYVIDCQAIRV